VTDCKLFHNVYPFVRVEFIEVVIYRKKHP